MMMREYRLDPLNIEWKGNKINMKFIFLHSQKHYFKKKFQFLQKEDNFSLPYLQFCLILQYEIIWTISSIFVLILQRT